MNFVTGSTHYHAGTSGACGMLGLTYFKRFRMETDLSREIPSPEVPLGYRLVPWRPDLLASHAEAKYQSFRNGIDSNVFPCLGEHEGCLRLMREISQKDGFLPGATWLVATDGFEQPLEYCGTIQGIRDRSGLGAIQNLGTTPEHRGQGLGRGLLLAALAGFRAAGLRRAYLEVTAQNEGAIRLYRRLGFHKVRTVYKAVEASSVAVR
ncbi:MAG TPA: GNAT family N-acetyltransferase [Pirellulales bacterium]